MTRIINTLKTKSYALLIGLLSITSIITFVSAQTISENHETDIAKALEQYPTPTIAPTISPAVTATSPAVQGEHTIVPTQQITKKPLNTSTQNSILTAPPTPFPPTLTPTPVIETIAVTLIQPNGTQGFTVAWKNDMNACDVLKQAKAEGDIASLTLDESYTATFGSPYVYEINGYKDSWVFLVNGISPSKGCTSVTIQKDDQVTWKFV